MESSQKRVLIVANRTAATPTLMEEIERRVRQEPTTFALLIPDSPSAEHTDWTLELALPLLERAARGPVEGLSGSSDPFEAIRDAVGQGNFDEIIISTLSKKASKWLRRDLVRKVEGLGLPVTAVMPRAAAQPGITESERFQKGMFGMGAGGG